MFNVQCSPFPSFSISVFQPFSFSPPPPIQGSRFKVQGSRFNGSRFNGSRFKVQRFKVQGSAVQGSRFNGSRFNGSTVQGSTVQPGTTHPPDRLHRACGVHTPTNRVAMWTRLRKRPHRLSLPVVCPVKQGRLRPARGVRPINANGKSKFLSAKVKSGCSEGGSPSSVGPKIPRV